MPRGIETVTVIGAGTMGAAVAGHLANAGLFVHLLDMAPTDLLPEEATAGLSLESPRVRNRIVQAGFERMAAARPANLFDESVVRRIRLGNLQDDFEQAVAEADWILEAIVERPGPKQALMARIEACAAPTAIVSTNTSGIPVGVIADGRSPDFARRFMGTHFFNPPRYLHLLELIPTAHTDLDLVSQMAEFLEDVLGKGVVLCKDTPNFIANRMLSFIQSDMLHYAVSNRMGVEEVDRLTGPLLGRPKSATFRLNDIIGVDIMSLVIENLYARVPGDEDRELLHAPSVTAVLQALLDSGHVGAKSGQGFYKTVVDESGRKSFWGLDLQHAAGGGHTVDYVAPSSPQWPSVATVRSLPLPERLRALVEAEDEAGMLVWHTLSRTLAYASKRVPEIAECPVDIDNAMKWGFAWEMGPFETWDALGVCATLERMDDEGVRVAPWVREMLDAGFESFYRLYDGRRQAYVPAAGSYRPLRDEGKSIQIATVKRSCGAVAENESASLVDLGDGVLLVEFHSKMNTFDIGTFQMLHAAVERLYGNAQGLVIGNQGPVFSAGLNLAKMVDAVQSGRFQDAEHMIRAGQDAFMALRKAPKPVVAAPFQRALGGGAEVALAADRIVAHAETYMGLVEVGVGFVPAWGGCKEMVRRSLSPHMHANQGDPTPFLRHIFRTIGFAKVSTSALDARRLGYLSGSGPHCDEC